MGWKQRQTGIWKNKEEPTRQTGNCPQLSLIASKLTMIYAYLYSGQYIYITMTGLQRGYLKILPCGNLHISLVHLTSKLHMFLAWVSEKLQKNIQQKSKELQTQSLLEIKKVNL